MCCAQTGSGKTAAFMVPILCRLDMNTGVLTATETFQGPALPQVRRLGLRINLGSIKTTPQSYVQA